MGATPNASAKPLMSAFSEYGFELRGAEYWPYVGPLEPRYPDDVMWGFYPQKGTNPPGETDPNPDSASPGAVRCAEASFQKLREFLSSARAVEFEKAIPANATRFFYLWTNDYSRAADPFPPGIRPARLWYWARKTPDPSRPAGYWKWEATLTQRGECLTPNVEEAVRALHDKP
jgi:hypothetical protein